MKQLLIISNVCIFLCVINTGLFARDYENSVVQIRVTTQDYDSYSPWQRKRHQTRWIHGCVIDTDKGIIVTLSLPLENHLFVEVSKHGEQKRYPARVILKDYKTGIAFITVQDNGFFKDLEPARLPEQRTEPGKGSVVKWDSMGRFKSYPTENFATSIQSYEGLGGALIHQMITGLDSGGDGEPVFQGEYLLGITAWFDRGEKTIKVNSAETIKWMLKDMDSGKYAGQPSFWLDVHYLQSDENLKAYLGMKNTETGILVLNVPPKVSGYGFLKENDVILAIDGIDIDDNGLCSEDLYGKLNFMWLIVLNHVVGDSLSIQIIRDKARKTISFPLIPEIQETILVPSYYRDQAPRYYISGGLLFQELTRSYMSNWGSDWEEKADKRLTYYTKNYWIYPTEERHRIVILNRVLPAVLNRGYHDMKNHILVKINGIKVRDLLHVRDILEKSTEDYLVFEFLGNENIVLKKNNVITGTNAILKQYGIEKQYNLN
ncbi:MAG: hypothetical protein JXB88_11760 [Spirochaetales bacterium]|nr:hypothetical protein [Spirochaetales bacterium]